jgi:hypothetical protein
MSLAHKIVASSLNGFVFRDGSAFIDRDQVAVSLTLNTPLQGKELAVPVFDF